MVNTVVLAGHYVSIRKNVMTINIIITKSNVKSYSIIVPIILCESLLKHIKKYISEGDIIGTKGYLNVQDGTLVCIAEKITFLSNSKK